MIQDPSLLKWVAVTTAAAASWLLCQWLARIPAVVPSTLGLRGRKRALSLRDSPLFARMEPLLCWLGGVFSGVPLGGRRAVIERRLRQAGYFLGIDADEYLGLCTCGALAGAVLGAALGLWAGDKLGGPFFCAALGGVAGHLIVRYQVSRERERRFREVSRQLPPEIDLAAMCMNAGMDMPAALSMLVQQGDDKDVLVEEFTLILQELELGRTRATALLNFADRVPTEPVREFVSAVVQAEEKGTPLAEVLRIQASMLRMRRSVLAEEAASRAGVMMVIPMMMLLSCLLILILGSLMIDTYEAELFQ